MQGLKDHQKFGGKKCRHIMGSMDPHSLCSLCRTCGFPQEPCKECKKVKPEIHAYLVQAMARRAKRLLTKAGGKVRDPRPPSGDDLVVGPSMPPGTGTGTGTGAGTGTGTGSGTGSGTGTGTGGHSATGNHTDKSDLDLGRSESDPTASEKELEGAETEPPGTGETSQVVGSPHVRSGRHRKGHIASTIVRSQLDPQYSRQSLPAGRGNQSNEDCLDRRGRSRSPRDSPRREQRYSEDRSHYHRGRSTEAPDHYSSTRDGRPRRRSRSPSPRERRRSRSRSRSYRSPSRRDERSRSHSRARSPRGKDRSGKDRHRSSHKKSRKHKRRRSSSSSSSSSPSPHRGRKGKGRREKSPDNSLPKAVLDMIASLKSSSEMTQATLTGLSKRMDGLEQPGAQPPEVLEPSAAGDHLSIHPDSGEELSSESGDGDRPWKRTPQVSKDTGENVDRESSGYNPANIYPQGQSPVHTDPLLPDPPAREDPEDRRYGDTILKVYEVFGMPPPESSVDDNMGGVAYDLMQDKDKEKTRHTVSVKSLPQSTVISRSIRAANSIVQGVSASPLIEDGTPREDAQAMGVHCNITPPVIRFKRGYYSVNHSGAHAPKTGEALFEKGFKVPTNASTVGIPSREAAVSVPIDTLLAWESLARATMQVTNHLDWFVGAAIKLLSWGEILSQEQSADVSALLSSASTALVHVAHLQARSMASMCTVRREALLKGSPLEDCTAHFLRSQPIGSMDIFNGQIRVARKADAQLKQEKLIAKSTRYFPQGQQHQPGGQPKGQHQAQSRSSLRKAKRKSKQKAKPASIPQTPAQPPPGGSGAGRGRGRGRGRGSHFSAPPSRPGV